MIKNLNVFHPVNGIWVHIQQEINYDTMKTKFYTDGKFEREENIDQDGCVVSMKNSKVGKSCP
jgi:hypothetical protein